MSDYRGRFAPSPSGPLHFGSLVAAVGSYLDARHKQGKWLIRIEDLDPPREKPGAAKQILQTLESFGFEWDEEVLYQSSRNEAYEEALLQLINKEWVYPCHCSRKQVSTIAREGLDGLVYPGTCRDGQPDQQDIGKSAALRIRLENREFGFVDRACGCIRLNLERDLGDFVVRRADNLFAYQLAVVVDDQYQAINNVVRGLDLLYSTPRQIYLQQLLNYPTPDYLHLPLVLDKSGNKLSKRDQAHPVDENHPIETLLKALEFLRQALPDQTPQSLDELWQWAIRHWEIPRPLTEK